MSPHHHIAASSDTCASIDKGQMSTSSASDSHRTYPLSPPPHSAANLPNKMAFQQPQTPRSPSQPASISLEKTSSIDIPKQAIDAALPTPANSTSGSAPSSAITDLTSTTAAASQSSAVESEDLSNKRKRDTQDSGDREQKKVHVEDRRLGIEDLHLDVGKKYLLCRTPHPKVQPDLSQDLFELYSLNSVAAKVARVLPNGEKNGLRKTYKGKIKELGIMGKFDVSAREDDSPNGFMAMLRHPEEEWTIQNRLGNEIEKGLSKVTLESLPKAMTMSKGVIPKKLWDNSVLALETDVPEKKAPAVAVPSKLSSVGANRGLGNPTLPGRMSKADAVRPKRNVKKRGYEESSYEGYGEGFVDDDMVDAGYSTGEGDDRALSQKRRKKTTPGHTYPGPMRHNSYGPGMVGA